MGSPPWPFRLGYFPNRPPHGTSCILLCRCPLQLAQMPTSWEKLRVRLARRLRNNFSWVCPFLMRLYSFIRVKLAVDAGEVNVAASAQVLLHRNSAIMAIKTHSAFRGSRCLHGSSGAP